MARFLFLSKGKKDMICLKNVCGSYDGQMNFQQSDPGVRAKFEGGKFETGDINIAKSLILSIPLAADRIAFAGIAENSSTDFKALNKDQILVLSKIKDKVSGGVAHLVKDDDFNKLFAIETKAA